MFYLRNAVVQAGTIALALCAITLPVDAGGELVPLAHLAPQLGFAYTWIGSESAVELSRPGVYVLVRTGNPLYDVNDSVESTSQAPQYRNNDIYIGAALVARLRSLAVKYAPQGRIDAPVAMPLPAAASGHGALTLAAVSTGVSDAIVVSGTGPANVPLIITLSGDISRDLPRVTLSRTFAQTDGGGKFAVQIATAPLHWQNATVLVSATSLPGVGEAHTAFVLGQPSPAIAHPVDETPRDFKPHH